MLISWHSILQYEKSITFLVKVKSVSQRATYNCCINITWSGKIGLSYCFIGVRLESEYFKLDLPYQSWPLGHQMVFRCFRIDHVKTVKSKLHQVLNQHIFKKPLRP